MDCTRRLPPNALQRASAPYKTNITLRLFGTPQTAYQSPMRRYADQKEPTGCLSGDKDGRSCDVCDDAAPRRARRELGCASSVVGPRSMIASAWREAAKQQLRLGCAGMTAGHHQKAHRQQTTCMVYNYRLQHGRNKRTPSGDKPGHSQRPTDSKKSPGRGGNSRGLPKPDAQGGEELRV